MDILYCSSLCSEDLFKNLNMNLAGQQVQKYHRTLVKGLAGQEGISIKCLSKALFNKKYIKAFKKKEKWNNVKINYVKVTNSSILGNLLQACSFFINVLINAKKSTIICLDTMNVAMGIGVFIAARIKKIKLIGIVTDFPDIVMPNSIYSKIGMKIIQKCDGYLLLTYAMNNKINKDLKKPFIVLEGQVSISQGNIEKKIRTKDKRIFLYAGLLIKGNAVSVLANAFCKAKLENTELHIYGSGEEEDYIKKIAFENPNVKYMGSVLNSEMVIKETEATLLINPRPTNQEFVKYSFPSKLLEYMVSGTPVLTTRLPGLSKDYFPYVYFIEKENEEGIVDALIEISKKSEEELFNYGNDARKFVLINKNEDIQAKRFYDFIKEKI